MTRLRALRWALLAGAGLLLAFGGWLVGASSYSEPEVEDPGDVLSILNRPAGPNDVIVLTEFSGYDELDRMRYLGSEGDWAFYTAIDSSFTGSDELRVCAIVHNRDLGTAGASCTPLSQFEWDGARAHVAAGGGTSAATLWVLPDGHADRAAEVEWATLIHDNAIAIAGRFAAFPLLDEAVYEELGLDYHEIDMSEFSRDDDE